MPQLHKPQELFIEITENPDSEQVEINIVNQEGVIRANIGSLTKGGLLLNCGITMEMANQLIGITMPDPGVSRVVAVDIAEALELAETAT